MVASKKYMAGSMIRFLLRFVRLTLVHSTTGALLAPILISIWEDRPFRDPFDYYLRWDDTQYSNGYSQRAFNEIEPGDDIDEVTKALGTPLKVWIEDRCPDCSEDERNLITNSYSSDSKRSTYWFNIAISYDKRTHKVIKKYFTFDD